MIKNVYIFPDVSKLRFLTGIILGLLFAVSFYSFITVLSDSSRIGMSIFFSIDEIWILSDSDRKYIMFIYAIFSMILGQAVVLKTWFEKPRAFLSSRREHRMNKMILNDISMLNLSFLSWISKLAHLLIIVLTSVIFLGYYIFTPNLSDYNYFWILIFVVLHLEQWKGIRLKYKNAAIKPFLLFTTSIILLGFLLSKISVYDFTKVDKHMLSNSVEHWANIQRPMAHNLDHSVRPFKEDVFIIQSDDTLSYYYKNEQIEIFEFNDLVSSTYITHYLIRNPYRTTINLHLDKSLKVADLRFVKEALSEQGFRRTLVSSTPYGAKYDDIVYRDYGIMTYRPSSVKHPFYDYKKESELILSNPILIEVIDWEIVKLGLYYFTFSQLDQLVNEINFKHKDGFYFYIPENNTVQHLISLQDFMISVAKKHREHYSKLNFSKGYHELSSAEKQELKERHEFLIIELPMKEFERVVEIITIQLQPVIINNRGMTRYHIEIKP